MTLVPTRVGMIPVISTINKLVEPCPHTRGDDPKYMLNDGEKWHLSPHVWG